MITAPMGVSQSVSKITSISITPYLATVGYNSTNRNMSQKTNFLNFILKSSYTKIEGARWLPSVCYSTHLAYKFSDLESHWSIAIGARGRIRTDTLLREADFKSAAAAFTPLGHKKEIRICF